MLCEDFLTPSLYYIYYTTYCPLIWMFYSRQINHKINKLHERALRIAYNDYFLSFEVLLSKDKSITVHQINLQ